MVFTEYPEGKNEVSFKGNVRAEQFLGDGSQLTGISAGGGAVYPLVEASGGTGTTTALQVVYPLAIASGGTASTTAADARVQLSVAASGSYTLWSTDRAGYSGASALTLTYGSAYPIAIASGGTGATTAVAAFDALAPTTTKGDVIYFDGTDNVRLASGAPDLVLTMSGALGIPQWTPIPAAATGQTVVFPLAIASGGTAADTSGAARQNLGVPQSGAYVLWTDDRAGYSGADALTLTYGTAYPLIIASGGTNATTAGDARTNLNVRESGSITSVAFPLRESSGGTASTTSGAARLILGIANSGSLQTTTSDQSLSSSAYYAPILFNPDTSAGITASNYPIGSILVVYSS